MLPTWQELADSDPHSTLHPVFSAPSLLQELKPQTGLTALHYACFYGRLDICHRAVEVTGALSCLYKLDNRGRTPIDLLPFTSAPRVRNQVYTWGKTDDWQLGYVKDTQKTPRKVSFPTASPPDITTIRLHRHFTLFLSSSGEVYSCGEGGKGRLGLGDAITSAFTPTQIAFPMRIMSISASDNHCLAVISRQLTESKALFAWGDNTYGQLGVEDIPYSCLPVQALKRIHSWNCVSAGKAHSAGVNRKGEGVIWGEGSKGQLLQSSPSRVSIVSSLPQFRPPEQLLCIQAIDDYTVIWTTAGNIYLSYLPHLLIFHLPKQFALTHILSVSILSDGLYCLGNNGRLFYSRKEGWSRAKEHYVMVEMGTEVKWMSEGAGLMVGRETGTVYEVRSGQMTPLQGITDAAYASTNGLAYGVLLPTYVRPYLSPAGLLPLHLLTQHHLISSLVLPT